MLGRVAQHRRAQAGWREWLKSRLSSDLDAHVTGVVERDDALTIFAESAAWSARLRFALAELEPQVREQNPGIQKVIVKVLPRR